LILAQVSLRPELKPTNNDAVFTDRHR
jgi:hypothetical protein